MERESPDELRKLVRNDEANVEKLKASLQEAKDEILRGECGPFDVEEILAAGRNGRQKS
jgi:hypothetical protein